MKIFEITSSPLYVFHGTTIKRWSEEKNKSGLSSLYLANDRTDAERYAKDFRLEPNDKPILIKFPVHEIFKYVKLDWADFQFGVFSVIGNIDEIKKIGQVINL